AFSDCFPAPRIQLSFGRVGGEKFEGNIISGYKNLDDALNKVRAARNAGLEWIALHTLSGFAPGELKAITTEARRLHLGIMAEGSSAASLDRALEVGVDSVEYVDQDKAALYPSALVRGLKQQGVYMDPTLSFRYRRVELPKKSSLLDDPGIVEFMPPSIATAVLQNVRSKMTDQDFEAIQESFPRLPAKFRQ